MTSSEPVVKLLQQSSTLSTSKAPVNFSVPLEPPTCETSGFLKVFKQEVSSAFTKPTEHLMTGWRFNPVGAGQATHSKVKTSVAATRCFITSRLDPAFGALEPLEHFGQP